MTGEFRPDENFEIKMTDEEWMAFIRYQRALEIPGRARPKKKDDKEEKPFQDRALERAVENLKKELNGGR